LSNQPTMTAIVTTWQSYSYSLSIIHWRIKLEIYEWARSSYWEIFGHIAEPILVTSMILDWLVMAREQLTSWLVIKRESSSSRPINERVERAKLQVFCPALAKEPLEGTMSMMHHHSHRRRLGRWVPLSTILREGILSARYEKGFDPPRPLWERHVEHWERRALSPRQSG